MKDKQAWVDHLASAADLQEEPIPVLPLIEICGDRRVLVEHHRGVTEYGENQIGIKVKYGTVCVTGQKLALSHMTRERLIVTGRIDGVRLVRR